MTSNTNTNKHWANAGQPLEWGSAADWLGVRMDPVSRTIDMINDEAWPEAPRAVRILGALDAADG